MSGATLRGSIPDATTFHHVKVLPASRGATPGLVERLYFASIGYASHPHLLVVSIQSFGPNDDRDAEMASLQAAAQPVLDSLIAPATSWTTDAEHPELPT